MFAAVAEASIAMRTFVLRLASSWHRAGGCTIAVTAHAIGTACRVRRCTGCVSATVMTSDLLRRATVELVVALLATRERSSLLLEIIHAHRWESGRSVVLCGIVMDLMHWHSRVYNVRLNGLLLNHRLDILMHVMVDMFARNRRFDAGRTLALDVGLLVLILALLLFQTALHLISIVVLERTVLCRHQIVMMLFGQGLRVVDWLLGGMVVVLVNLLVGGCRCSLVLCPRDILVLYSRINPLVDCSVMVT